ncbi:hypothetical protein L3X38_010830 [Prunus dulcis]|uniref:Uncharacterized protein n=1 Tax=Prunus dulcis TaxID=3755 RepID=A0AAD4ZEJ4_PRUDU|nr:hypothetical protein L3X38_010830 [Prunus dulcis]
MSFCKVGALNTKLIAELPKQLIGQGQRQFPIKFIGSQGQVGEARDEKWLVQASSNGTKAARDRKEAATNDGFLGKGNAKPSFYAAASPTEG